MDGHMTDRRNFIGTLLAASEGFMILPGAGRVWKVVRPDRWIVNPDWVNAPYRMHLFTRHGMLLEDGSMIKELRPFEARYARHVHILPNGEWSEPEIPRLIRV